MNKKGLEKAKKEWKEDVENLKEFAKINKNKLKTLSRRRRGKRLRTRGFGGTTINWL